MGVRGFGRSCRVTTEAVRRIDIRFMRKQGYLEPGVIGTLNWHSRGVSFGSLLFSSHKDKLILSYKVKVGSDSYSIERIIKLLNTPCHFGGSRLWFCCPSCFKRVGVLYGLGEEFKCRHCYNLTYASQQQGYMDRVISQKHALGQRIFEDYNNGSGYIKRKGLHWKTFQKLYSRYKALDQAWCVAALKYIET